MLEVVFDCSAEGSLKVAQSYGKGSYHPGCISVIVHADGRQATQEELDASIREAEEKERIAWESAVPMGGNTSDVFCFPLGLSVGDISNVKAPESLDLLLERAGKGGGGPHMVQRQAG